MKQTRRWTPEQAQKWYERQPWSVGCNFLPSTAVNDTEMWQAETFDRSTIERELGWARGLGFNSVRVFLQYRVWDADPQGFLQRFNLFLSLADMHGLRAAPILFDDCCFAGKEPYLGRQDDPVPGVHNSGWVPSPGPAIGGDKRNWPRLEQYVRDVVGQFADDPRILIWDLYNEPGANEKFDSRDLLTATFEWARAAEPSQPMTSGVFRGKLDGSQTLEELGAADERSRIMIENSDVLSFHNYCDLSWIEGSRRAFSAAGRPMFCTEWMARGPMASLFKTHLPFWRQHKIGCFNWGLVAGRTQTYYPWGSPKDSPEPATWHHDILRRDGTPFDAEEAAFIRQVTGASA